MEVWRLYRAGGTIGQAPITTITHLIIQMQNTNKIAKQGNAIGVLRTGVHYYFVYKVVNCPLRGLDSLPVPLFVDIS